jgi:hypothetical protein
LIPENPRASPTNDPGLFPCPAHAVATNFWSPSPHQHSTTHCSAFSIFHELVARYYRIHLAKFKLGRECSCCFPNHVASLHEEIGTSDLDDIRGCGRIPQDQPRILSRAWSEFHSGEVSQLVLTAPNPALHRCPSQARPLHIYHSINSWFNISNIWELPVSSL